MTVTPGVERELDQRYGRTPRRASRSRWWAVGVAAAFVVVLVAWVVWGGLLGRPAQLESRDVGYVISDDGREIDVRWRLTVEPGTETRCAVQALSDSFAIVGWRIVDLPPSDQRTREFRETVRTVEEPDTGLIHSCWVV
ncbi:uncharacterized protein DUF4307 [Diaminobutyricimonas aerilata]|uniref:Uncharacterized protein DUF4307 n=1 Tax=Diaminobutyricimonas aerilata TaxID=1162967 RepID=A0A2M9CI01_9MICO|nr:DUF4307 domain-containing protein [Diaminobutyricimonas aerilata]PJJ71502.1 uncharacterized protein DUF4307 [Diaminobutyricimonas aerilata]